MLTRNFAFAGILVASTLLTASIASADIPGADNTIHACRNNTTHAIRLQDVEAEQICDRRVESEIVWNAKPPSRVVVRVVSDPIADTDAHGLDIFCPFGFKVIAGGGSTSPFGTISSSTPIGSFSGGPEGWSIQGRLESNITGRIHGYAICLSNLADGGGIGF